MNCWKKYTHNLTWCNTKGYDTVAMFHVVHLTVQGVLCLEHTILAGIAATNCKICLHVSE